MSLHESASAAPDLEVEFSYDEFPLIRPLQEPTPEELENEKDEEKRFLMTSWWTEYPFKLPIDATLEEWEKERMKDEESLTPMLLWKETVEQARLPWAKREYEKDPNYGSCQCKKMYNGYEPYHCLCTEDMTKRNKVCSSCHITQTRSCHRDCGVVPSYYDDTTTAAATDEKA
jgi:hypothetical protein